MSSTDSKSNSIVITGAAGFIGSCLVSFLNSKGFDNLILVDEFERSDKLNNLHNKKYSHKIERDLFFEWLEETKPVIDFIFHLGARTDTTEFDYAVHQRLNFEYSQDVWNYAMLHQIPLVYASSAATYGCGELGYNDDHSIVHALEPLNPYGVSKNELDKWVLRQHSAPPFWAGLKFFNVYGPNEYHKGRMASVIFHAFNQVKQNGYVNLFKSHRPDYKDGEQLRDFVYVKDILHICYWLMAHRPASAIYNAGTGKARSFYDLALATFAGMGIPPDIRFIDMPEDIRDKYQYFTEANMTKLKTAGYTNAFYTLEAGIDDYVKHYLIKGNYY
ncbi:ADP-glyceromanno-heptose 6-epimerase [Agriterribacter sp.]|uniref:ADP-glyceromanno-heptose 6-epimerase n=1 Tax=Agriterribacter sp. TaxID=2821509 RepID=UPI002B7CEECD|nr:ADP-glyceromanno-heptose 6-epimerase [Agriterribacter sp.]HTN05808.1 ADP-glyceromanno-heptose 6-epimerase [Agriterribacter sp.]